jgi:hypothetical protein
MAGMKPEKEADELLEQILVDAYGEDEQLWAFRQSIEDDVPLPLEGAVIGEAVRVIKIDYHGNPQRGLLATCERPDGKTYQVALADVQFPDDSPATPYVRAYRQWLGASPTPKPRQSEARRGTRSSKAAVGEIDLTKPVELVVLGTKRQESTRCRLVGSDKELTLRSAAVWKVAPGEIITVEPRKHWTYARHPYLSGDITDTRIDVPALGLVPLRLTEMRMWDPSEEYWGEESEPLEDWTKEIIAHGPRPEYEMEKVVPGTSEDTDVDTDPILQAVELRESGDLMAADLALTALLIADLRCLDAHAHLGNLCFDHRPELALRHYDIGRRIGELSLGPEFTGLLPWGRIDNRPYLRCLHGYGLSLWRLNRFEEAAAVFARMLWLNPTDNQGIRFLIDDVQAGRSWEESEGH